MRTLRCLRGGVRRVLLHSPPCKTSASNQTSCTSSSSLRAAASFAASNYSHSSAHAAVKGTFRETFSLREMTQSLKEVVQQKQQNVFGGLRRAFSSSTAEKSSSAASSNSKREAALASLQKKEQEALSTFFHEPKGKEASAWEREGKKTKWNNTPTLFLFSSRISLSRFRSFCQTLLSPLLFGLLTIFLKFFFPSSLPLLLLLLPPPQVQSLQLKVGRIRW